MIKIENVSSEQIFGIDLNHYQIVVMNIVVVYSGKLVTAINCRPSQIFITQPECAVLGLCWAFLVF